MNDPLSISTDEEDEEEHECIETKRKWTQSETAAFLVAFSERKHEFLNRQKKKLAMRNVLNDLLGQGALIRPATVELLTAKLNSLLQDYKRKIDKASKTGSNQTPIPFENQLQEIFEDEPQLANIFSFNMLTKRKTLLVPMLNQPEEDEDSPLIERKKVKLKEKCVEGSRRKWTNEETAAFLNVYAKRKDEFLHSRKKIFAMENVMNDLISQNALTLPTTIYMLTSKMRSLLRAYKRSKTGNCQFPIKFEEQLDEIFEDSPELANTYCPGMFDKPEMSMEPSEEEEIEESESADKRRRWTNEEIRAFLTAYAKRKDEFLHVRKKRCAMEKVLADLSIQNALTQPTTVGMLQSKIKSLWRAYKHGKVRAFRTGVDRTSIPFEDELEAIFGDRLALFNRQSASLSETPETSLPLVTEDKLPTIVSTEHEFNQRNVHATAVKVTDKTIYLEEKLKLKRKYLEEKIKLKKESKKNKQKRHEEKLAILNQFLGNFHNET